MKYDRQEPSPTPVRHTVRFTVAEVIEALEEYAVLRGDIDLPSGKRFLWGLSRDSAGINEPSVTLVVDKETEAVSDGEPV